MSTLLKNPIIFADVPDVDVLRHGTAYYMVSTTMHVFPGCPIMKSEDLAHWEIISYVFDVLEEDDCHTLADGKGIYGRGQWATSLRFHNGTFYACFSCNETSQFYVYSTEDIERGPWKRNNIPQLFHDPAVLFDENRAYVMCNCGDIRIVELEEDMSGLKEGGIDQLLFSTPKENIGLRCEGGHAYKINDYYYLIYIEWPSDGKKRRREICYRSKNLLGPYERKEIFDDDMGYHNKGIAQGAIFDTPQGDWYAMLFQDHDAVGRIPYILPVHWEDGWPMIGEDKKAPRELLLPFEEKKTKDIVICDDFQHEENQLYLQWQWNHNPDNTLWSFTKRNGYLRLENGHLSHHILTARNTLTQRTIGPACTITTMLDTRGMKDGDRAGLVALQSHFGTVGIWKEGEECYAVMSRRGEDQIEYPTEKIKYKQPTIYLKITFDFTESRDIAEFYISEDGNTWRKLGEHLQMLYTLDHFMGYRGGLFSYPTKEIGGYADFAFYHILGCQSKEN